MKTKHLLELEVLIPNMISQVANTPREKVEAYALAQSRLYDLNLEYFERTQTIYRKDTNEI